MKEYINKLKSLIRVFMSQFSPKKSKEKGFSLIELLVVVAIMGILATVAIPAFKRYQERSKIGVVDSSLKNLAKGITACLTLNSRESCLTLASTNVACDDISCTASHKGAMNPGEPLCINVNRDNEVYGCVQVNPNSGVTEELKVGIIGSDQLCSAVQGECDSGAVKANSCPASCTTPGSCSGVSDGTAITCGTGSNTFAATLANMPQCNTDGEC